MPNRSVEQSKEILGKAIELRNKANLRSQKVLSTPSDVLVLEQEIEKNEQRIHELEASLDFIMNEKVNFENLRTKSKVIDNLNNLLQQAIKNYGAKQGTRYDKSLKKLTTLSFVSSTKSYKILNQELNFPTERTAQKYKKELFDQFFPGVNDVSTLLDGTEDNIKLLINKLYDDINEEYQKDVILAIDACSLNANVIVSPNGDISGLREKNTSILLKHAKL